MKTRLQEIVDRFFSEEAVVTTLPAFSGDGYGYGGGTILSIGDRSIQFGEDYEAHKLAEEVARRWNASLPTPQPETPGTSRD
ncbi:hypothetical protein [Nitratireductor sp. GCM10026969]|uniref:hypothetical protein n=1 Tax=Nitratireductor sp. GCM10026969 TaxID=3252645 RepID=UPI0036149DFC